VHIGLNGFFSRTTWVSWHQKDQIDQNNLDFNEAADDGVAVQLAGPYTSHAHLAPDRQPHQSPAPHRLIFTVSDIPGQCDEKHSTEKKICIDHPS